MRYGAFVLGNMAQSWLGCTTGGKGGCVHPFTPLKNGEGFWLVGGSNFCHDVLRLLRARKYATNTAALGKSSFKELRISMLK